MAEADGNRTRQRPCRPLTGFEDRGTHQASGRLHGWARPRVRGDGHLLDAQQPSAHKGAQHMQPVIITNSKSFGEPLRGYVRSYVHAGKNLRANRAVSKDQARHESDAAGRAGGALHFDDPFFFFQAEDGIRDYKVTGVQTCAFRSKVRRRNLPRALFRHLIDRAHEREITTDQLELLFEWLETEPEVPEGKWFKPFAELTVCGEGELIKTFLRSDQAPFGKKVN